MKHRGTAVLRVLFVEIRNAWRRQMAEAISSSLGRANFVYSSAGIDPHPIDPFTIKFLAEKGLDITHHKSKGVSQIPNLDHYQVIVALDRDAKKIFPPSPTKTVALDWNVKDPPFVEGSPEQIP